LKYFYLFLFLTAYSVFGQSDIRFTNYAIADGLSQSFVTTVIEDQQHSIWVGTQEGLNQFNGQNFQVYNRENSKGLASSYITSSAKSKNGLLWFGSANGLVSFNPVTEKFKTHFLNNRGALFIEHLVIDHQDKLWLLAQGNQLYCFDVKKNKFISPPKSIKKLKVLFMYATPDGKMVFVHDNNAVSYLSKGSQKLRSIPAHPFWRNAGVTISSIYANKGDEKIYFGTNKGIYSYRWGEMKTILAFKNLNQIISSAIVGIEKHQSIWYFATARQGLFQYSEKGNVVNCTEDIFQKNTLLNNNLSCLRVDKSGVYWIGSERGLSSFNPKERGFYSVGPSGDLTKGLPSQNVWSFCELGAYMYIGTDLGISRVHRQTGVFQHFKKNKGQKSTFNTDGSILCMAPKNKNAIFFGCFDGLYEFIPNTGTFKKIDLKLKEVERIHKRIYAIVRWRDELFFIGTNAGVLLFNSKTQKTEVFEHDNLHPKSTISKGVCRNIYKDQLGKFWFTTSNGGLNLYDAKRKIIHPYFLNDKIMSVTKDLLTSMYQTEKHEYYIGTLGSGLIQLNTRNNSVKLYTKKEGLPNNVIYAILPGKNKDIWMSTNRGLASINTITHEIKKFNEINGLVCNEFNSNAYYRALNGELYFGGIYGYSHFNPNEINNNSLTTGLNIIKITIDPNKAHPKGEIINAYSLNNEKNNQIELDYHQRSFTVHFQASNLTAPSLINYKYILVGDQIDSKNFSRTNDLNFSALSAGEYHLEIFAKIGDGPWSTEPAVLNFKINQPYWATWWYWTIIIIITGLVVLVMIKQRIEHVRRDKVKLEVKIAKRTKEIRDQKTQIEIQNELIKEEKNKVVEQQGLLMKEKEKAEQWLKNALPLEVIKELKMRGKVQAKAYESVSVMFTDVVGFTKIAESMSPTRLVSKLDVIFKKFDAISVSNNLEKIKTIGDAYMVAGGIPEKNSTHPIDTCIAALQMQHYMQKLKYEAIANYKDYWSLRIGINTGPVTTGVIGKLKIAYDVWGATVNQAQRMEMLSEPGKVTVSGNTFLYVEPYFECEFKGKAQTKSKTLVDMYVVHRIKPELSENGEGLIPNDRFYQIVQLHFFSNIKYYKVEHQILKKLSAGLSEDLLYHSVKHTKDVVKAVERIALIEGVTDEGLFLLKTAALFHDAGFIKQYDSNEAIGAQMALDILPKYGYTEQHIKTIVALIYVTEIPHKPVNKLQEIMCDADLDYLGRDDFEVISDRLRQELRKMGKITSDRTWDEIQVVFLKQHRYFSATSIANRQTKKEENLAFVENRLLENRYQD